jgi:hypothetical protein
MLITEFDAVEAKPAQGGEEGFGWWTVYFVLLCVDHQLKVHEHT